MAGSSAGLTRSPNGRHQLAVGRIYWLLDDAAPPGVEVLPAPYDWWISEIECYEPDVVVFHQANFDPGGPLRATPLLVVEVSSRSTRLHDLNAKLAAYAANGCPHYWVVDPDEPSVVAFRLAGADYEEVARTAGDAHFEVYEPFSVGFSPAQLVACSSPPADPRGPGPATPEHTGARRRRIPEWHRAWWRASPASGAAVAFTSRAITSPPVSSATSSISRRPSLSRR